MKRRIVISVCVPVTFTLDVSRDDEDDEWKIDRIVRQTSDLTPRALCEHMQDEDFEQIAQAAESSKDRDE